MKKLLWLKKDIKKLLNVLTIWNQQKDDGMAQSKSTSPIASSLKNRTDKKVKPLSHSQGYGASEKADSSKSGQEINGSLEK